MMFISKHHVKDFFNIRKEGLENSYNFKNYKF